MCLFVRWLLFVRLRELIFCLLGEEWLLIFGCVFWFRSVVM